jgi:hypothetical protein
LIFKPTSSSISSSEMAFYRHDSRFEFPINRLLNKAPGGVRRRVRDTKGGSLDAD